MEDLISVIVPVYNVGKYFRPCLESIRTQSYKNIEVILVDDGSTDGSQKICDEYTHIDERFICIHKKNGGLSDARNEGIDSDDYMHRDAIKILYQNLTDNDADLAIGNYRRVKPDEAVDLEANPDNTITVFLIIYSLMVVQRLIEAFHLLQPLSKALAPLMRVFGLPQQVSYMWLVGNVLGISYGSAVMLELQDKGMINKEDANDMNFHLIMNHSMLEDTIVFAATGISALWIIGTRVFFALILVWGRKWLKN